MRCSELESETVKKSEQARLSRQESQFRSFGKWILAGEHAVLRGRPALVFPIESRFIEMKVEHLHQPVKVQLVGTYGEEFSLLFWALVDRALACLGRQRSELRGQLLIDCQIPLGAGLGASAALCVSVGRWLQQISWLKDHELYEFSRELENLFHGESSGVDIAVALEQRGLRFVRGEPRKTLHLDWKPHWYLSYCGERGVTSECVGKVKALGESNPPLALEIDQQMELAVKLAEGALCRLTSTSLRDLKTGIDVAGDCFVRWGLCEGALGDHLQMLRDQGALAVKPTGSGGGGYALSLWESAPPEQLLSQLISI